MAKKKEPVATDLLENPDALIDQLSRTEEFFLKNKKIASIIGIATALLAGGYLGYTYYTTTQNEEGQVAMFPAINYFEQENNDQALKGNGVNSGLEDIADEYSMTKAGNLSALYVGVIKLKSGQYDEAIEFLTKFSSSDKIVQGRAYSLIGDAYMEKEEANEAILWYKKAADYYPNDEFTPNYLIKLGISSEKTLDYEAAAKAYKTLIEKYPNATEANDAKKYLAKAEASIK